jgi:tRNA (guanine37-N1)-methyltransferase
MRSRALVVPRAEGEQTRRALVLAGLLRTDLRIRSEGDGLAFPLLDGAIPAGLGEARQLEFDPVARPPASSYADLLEVPPEIRARLPRAFDVVGDVVLIRIPEELEGRRIEIGEALLRFVPGTRIVGRDLGVHGPDRRRQIERLAGSGDWRTRHRENGIELDVDLERAYFSPRLAREHARVAEEVRAGDRVYDLCCGVGPFALTIARDGRAAQVTAVDANPDAIVLLRSSAVRLGCADRITAREGPIEAFLPTAPPVERVICNLPLEGIKYAPSVARAVAPRGRFYYYEVTARDGVEARSREMEALFEPKGRWSVVEHHAVHPYSPSTDLTAFVLERGA